MSGPPSTPSLTDHSDSTSARSCTPPPSSPPEDHPLRAEKTPTKPMSTLPSNEGDLSFKPSISSPSTPCAKCSKPLFRTKSGGKFVTVPEESNRQLPPRSFHVECFRCAVCDNPFEETKNGQAIFVRSSTGCCHIGASLHQSSGYR